MNNNATNQPDVLGHDEIQQTLLELHYGLLDDVEAARWRARIATDAETARAWADVLALVGRFAVAAKLPIPAGDVARSRSRETSDDVNKTSEQALETSVRTLTSSTSASSTTTNSTTTNSMTHSAKKPKRRWWLIGVKSVMATAAMLLVASIGLRYWHRLPEPMMVPVRLQAESVSDAERTGPNQFQIVTSRGGSRVQAVPATLQFQVNGPKAIMFQTSLKSDREGRTKFELPSSVKVPTGAYLTVTATPQDSSLRPTSTTMMLEPTRCLTSLSTDRPLYRPGETIYFRSLTLERYSLRGDLDLPIHFELRDPSGAVVPNAVREGVTQRGVGNGAFALPVSSAGGQYTLVARSLDGFFPEEQRTVQVQQYRVPRFKKELEFKRRSHGPGDVVEADFSALRAEGGPLAKTPIRITAKIDGREVAQQQALTNDVGSCVVSFKLPEHIAEGDGQLAVSIDDGGTQETIVKTIPIQLGKVNVEFFPEGGPLVVGLENRVYFTARNPLGKPIHVAGQVLDSQGREVASIATMRDGLGSFRFVPKTGERYLLKVTQPADVTNTPTLPVAVTGSPVLDAGRGVFPTNEALSFQLRSSEARRVLVQASCRGQSVGESKFDLRVGDNALSLPLPKDVGGVIRLTVLDPTTTPARPLVERLVFRENGRRLNVAVVDRQGSGTSEVGIDRSSIPAIGQSHSQPIPNSEVPDAGRSHRSPGDPLRLTLQVRDESGKPAPAMLGVAVVDDAALSLKEHELPALLTHFMLTSELQKPEDLEHANFYLDGKAESVESLDLLLGTQGWRRFVESNLTEPNPLFREQITKLLELNGRSMSAVRSDNDIEVDRCLVTDNQRRQQAWNELRANSLVIIVPILTACLLSFLIRPWRRLSVNGTVWMCVAALGLTSFALGTKNFSKVADSMRRPQAAKSLPQWGRALGYFSEVEGMKFQSETMAARPWSDMGSASSSIAADEEFHLSMVSEVAGKRDDGYMDGFSSAALESSRTMLARPTSPRQPTTGKSDENTESSSKPPANAAGDILPSRILTPQELQRLLSARGLDAASLANQLLDELRFPIREYSHKHTRRETGLREDFAETLFWQPLLITDSNGEATIRFDLSDSVTTFRVLVDAHNNDGRIGSGGGEVVSRLPFQLEPKLPLEVTTGDRIDLPVAVINQTADRLPIQLGLSVDSLLEVVGERSRRLELDADGRRREFFSLNVTHGSAESDAILEFRGVAGSPDRGTAQLADAVRRKLHVSPSGYPVRDSLAGVIEGGSQRVTVKIPNDVVPGSVAVTLRAYPTPLADLLSGVESILQEPHGCFEQTTSTNYPNTMALQYLQQNQLANPEVTRKAKGFLDRGYQKLTGFECKQRGYEWFGHDPGHEALTAFGLMQFQDMSEIMPVDAEMLARTRTWLLNRRDGKGGFQRNPRHLHVWSVSAEIVDAYVLWALTEADAAVRKSQSSDLKSGQPTQRAQSDLSLELDHLTQIANGSRDSYLLALSAAALLNAGRTADGNRLLTTLSELQAADGSLTGSTTVTQSGGLSLQVETTALAAIAWMKSPTFGDHTRRAIKWITTHREGHGGFGSTQATVLALKSLVGYMKTVDTVQQGGTLQVLRSGDLLAQAPIPAGADAGSIVELTGLGSKLAPGNTELEIKLNGVDRLPFAMEVTYHAPNPPSDPNCPLDLTTKLSGGKIVEKTDAESKTNTDTKSETNTDAKSGTKTEAETPTIALGDTIRLDVSVKNRTDRGLPMTVAVIGFPAGLEPRTEELNELRDAVKFDYYELRPREVICYWRTVTPQASLNFAVTLTATVPGDFTSPASRTYLYYTAEQKQWIAPMRIQITR